MVSISGLLGGHSGVDINKGRLNAIHGLARLLQAAAGRVPMHISSVDGGDRSNAIPRESKAVVVLSEKDELLLKEAIDNAAQELAAQYQSIEVNIKVSVEIANPAPNAALSADKSAHLLSLLRAIPSGVLAMSQDLVGLVETSNNCGVINTTAGSVDITCNSRSSVSAALDDVTATLTSIAAVAGASAVPGPAYPGWKPDPNSPTLKVLRVTYKNLFNKDAEVAAVHAGLECGVINGKIPNLDMVSFGPTVVALTRLVSGSHIDSVGKFYKLLGATLTNLSAGMV